MCGCGKNKKPMSVYKPLYKQVLQKDRLGRVITVKVPIINQRLIHKKIQEINRLRKLKMGETTKIETEIDTVLNI
jgi:hypothetical protein